MVRVQVLMEETEREEFRRLAQRSGMSLSAWLRQAGMEELARQGAGSGIDSKQALRDFFDSCDSREEGLEPDWDVHQRVIEESKRSGESKT